jgi:hypothetical protein
MNCHERPSSIQLWAMLPPMPTGRAAPALRRLRLAPSRPVPELFICGYSPEDLVLRPALQPTCPAAVEAPTTTRPMDAHQHAVGRVDHSPHGVALRCAFQLDQAAPDFSSSLYVILNICCISLAHRARHCLGVFDESREHLQ